MLSKGLNICLQLFATGIQRFRFRFQRLMFGLQCLVKRVQRLIILPKQVVSRAQRLAFMHQRLVAGLQLLAGSIGCTDTRLELGKLADDGTRNRKAPDSFQNTAHAIHALASPKAQ